MNNHRQELTHSFSSDVNSRSTVTDPVIVREIRKLTEIMPATQELAISIYYNSTGRESTRSPRGNKQLHWIFMCVYRAYFDQGIYMTPKRIASICGLSHEHIEKALSTIPIHIPIEPIQLIAFYLNEMHVEGIIDNSDQYFAAIEPFYNRMYRSAFGEEVILDSPARNTAIGLIAFFFDTFPDWKRPTKEQYETIFESSTSCITRYRTKISNVYHRI